MIHMYIHGTHLFPLHRFWRRSWKMFKGSIYFPLKDCGSKRHAYSEFWNEVLQRGVIRIFGDFRQYTTASNTMRETMPGLLHDVIAPSSIQASRVNRRSESIGVEDSVQMEGSILDPKKT